MADTYDAASVVIIVFISIALYNVVELNFRTFATFKRYSGLYFWSFLVAIWGVAFNAVGYLLRDRNLTSSAYIYATLILIGWCAMVTGQSAVLYSRLHIILPSQRLLRFVLVMIIFNAIWLHIPIIVLVYGANSSYSKLFEKPYSIYERIQLLVFFLQEFAISGLYVWRTTKVLSLEKTIGNGQTHRKIMYHLIYINLMVIILDISVICLEFANLYDIQTAWKPLVYSVKLKLEFGVLNRIIKLSQASRANGSHPATHSADHTDDIAMDRFALGTHRKLRGESKDLGLSYQVEVGKDVNAVAPPHHHASVVKTTELVVQSDRISVRKDSVVDSLNSEPGVAGESAMWKGGSASSASSKTQLTNLRRI